MRKLFTVLAVISVLFAPIASFATLVDFAHNQYQGRQERLDEATQTAGTSAHFGLTKDTLAGLDEFVAKAYKGSVYDGYKLGRGYQRLWLASMALDGLLLISSMAGLRLCKRLDERKSD